MHHGTSEVDNRRSKLTHGHMTLCRPTDTMTDTLVDA